MTLTNPLPRRASLHEQTYQTLRTSILSGELPPGDRLVETQLATQLEVSRTPIREALRQLQREGLVAVDSSGGLRVISVSVSDAVHLYDCRIALEEAAVRDACLNASDLTLDELQQSIAQSERAVQREASTLNTFEMLNLDYQFHRKIAESTGNPWLTDLLDQVFDKMMLLRVQTTRHNPRVLEICHEHRQICGAIASRDPATAIASITEHLNASKVRVVSALEALQTPQSVDV
ncbi:GntR family transcriptional regulator [Leptolyngbya iicbica]|uniref:GntR family transcriptional regulator n=1 Tax=Leptolyngbya iicbica TaxID=3161580 RepID=UPI000585223D|nr:GntR family transcriptional regulator [Leptolyngbya sp. LK]